MASEPEAALGPGQWGLRGPRAWAARRPLVCFFGLTCAISWAIWLSEPLLERYDPVGSQWYGMLAPYGPALAAIVVAALAGRERLPPAPPGRRLLPAALTLAAAAWAGWGQLDAIAVSPRPALAAALWLALTALPAWIVWLAGARARGLRELLGSLTRWRQPLNSYLLALLLIPVAGLTGIVVLRALGDPWPVFPRGEPPLRLAHDLAFVLVSTMLYGGGLAEEPGWRGFALPRLQRRLDPLTASAVLSIAWSLWHLPLHYLAAGAGALPLGQAVAAGVSLQLLSILPVSITYTWLYNRTGGSLLLLVIMHASANDTPGWWLPVTPGLYLGTIALAPVLVLLDRMWRRRG